MTHLSSTLPRQIELLAVRTDDYAVEVVETDGGFEVRNLRHANSKRKYEISFPASRRNDPIYQAVLALYAAANGRLNSFNFVDWTDETGATIVPVRFDSELRITGVDYKHDHIETLQLVEVFV